MIRVLLFQSHSFLNIIPNDKSLLFKQAFIVNCFEEFLVSNQARYDRGL